MRILEWILVIVTVISAVVIWVAPKHRVVGAVRCRHWHWLSFCMGEWIIFVCS